MFEGTCLVRVAFQQLHDDSKMPMIGCIVEGLGGKLPTRCRVWDLGV